MKAPHLPVLETLAGGVGVGLMVKSVAKSALKTMIAVAFVLSGMSSGMIRVITSSSRSEKKNSE